MDEIRQELRDFIAKEFKLSAPPDDGSLLIDEGIIDSLAIFAIIGFMEQRFAIKINPDDVTIDNFRSISAMEELIRSTLASRGASAKVGAC